MEGQTGSTSASRIRRLLVVRLSAMGDVIHTLPAVAALREAFPETMIGWAIEERWAELLCTRSARPGGARSPRRPLADRVHTFNLRGWRRSLLSARTWEQIRTSFGDLQAENYEVAVDFQGAIRSALLASWSGAPTIFGFAEPRENLASLFYTRQVQARGTHVIEQNLSLASAVAWRALSLPPVAFPQDELVQYNCQRALQALGGADYLILNPGAGWGAKQWPAERYGQVAKRLSEGAGLKSLINFGPGEEDLARAAEAASGGAAVASSGSVSELIVLTRRARLVIGGDTGPLHLGAALRIPVVGIFGPTNPARNGPFGTRSIVLRNPLSPITHVRRKEADEAMLEITPEDVIQAALKLLKVSGG
ncbi:MAG: lipopolysaccharide heptosyltransferase I [Acidobacteria bacterium]|nr:MAG: lipopolysaccharide heptosyltransferase I [Acidobacteriota bacterium]